MSVLLSRKNQSPQQKQTCFKIHVHCSTCTFVCTCLWWTHNFYGALHIIIDILKYISITTCKQHNSPVGSLGFWVDQFLWDSWVPLTCEFTSSTNSSFFLFMQIHDITSPWKTLIPRYTILNHISYIKYK